MMGGDNRRWERLEAIMSSGTNALAAVLDRIIANPELVVTAIDMARPQERVVIQPYFVRADLIDWHEMEFRKGGIHYVDLCIGSRATSPVPPKKAALHLPKSGRKPGRPSSRESVLSAFDRKHSGRIDSRLRRLSEIARELKDELGVSEQIETIAGWLSKRARTHKPPDKL